MLNKCQFIGRVGGKPEIRYTPNGGAVANFTLASTEKWKDKQGQQQERTEWVRAVAFGKLAEIIEQYVGKGDLLYIEGKQQTREWEKDGIKRYTTETVLNEMKMLGSRGDNQGQRQDQKAQQQPADDFDSDIPFAPLGLQYRNALHMV